MSRFKKSLAAFLVTLGVMGQIIPLQASTLLPGELVSLEIQAFDKNGVQQKISSVPFTATSATEVLDVDLNATVLDPGAQVGISVVGTELELQQYQIIKQEGTGTPSIPGVGDSKWVDLGEVEPIQANTTGAYLDLLPNKGFLSTKHYNYKYDSTEYGAGKIPPRGETFGYPIGKDLVIQKAELDPNKQYHNTENEAAFFANGPIGKTTLDATYTPPVAGTYKFSVYSNSGAYGYIMMNGIKKIIVDDLTTSNTLKSHTLNTEVTLIAGKEYTIHMEWQQKASDHIAPRLQYQIKNGSNWPSAQVIPTECFSNERYVGGGNKAVKYWGYIIPDVTGKFNFGSYSDDGAYGYIISEEKEIVFVEDWAIAAAYNRSGDKNKVMPEIDLVKGKVYPIYMEWYEGCPVDKAFTPRYIEAGKDSGKPVKDRAWKDIPTEWFFASSNATPGEINEGYFVPTTANVYKSFPTAPGTYYVALQVKSADNTVRQIISGPFKITGMNVSFAPPSKNYVVPESLSNVSYEVTFAEESKDIKYEINLNEMIIAKLGTYDLVNYDFGNAIITFTKDSTPGTPTIKLVKGTDYNCNVNAAGTGFDIALLSTANSKVVVGDKHNISIYLPTTFASEDIRYGNMETTPVDLNTYVGKFLNTIVKVKVNLIATPVIRPNDPVTGLPLPPTDGTVQSQEKEIELIYRSMPKIL